MDKKYYSVLTYNVNEWCKPGIYVSLPEYGPKYGFILMLQEGVQWLIENQMPVSNPKNYGWLYTDDEESSPDSDKTLFEVTIKDHFDGKKIIVKGKNIDHLCKECDGLFNIETQSCSDYDDCVNFKEIEAG